MTHKSQSDLAFCPKFALFGFQTSEVAWICPKTELLRFLFLLLGHSLYCKVRTKIAPSPGFVEDLEEAESVLGRVKNVEAFVGLGIKLQKFKTMSEWRGITVTNSACHSRDPSSNLTKGISLFFFWKERLYPLLQSHKQWLFSQPSCLKNRTTVNVRKRNVRFGKLNKKKFQFQTEKSVRNLNISVRFSDILLA